MQASESFFQDNGSLVAWFHGDIDGDKASTLLRDHKEGSYLVRNSRSHARSMVASVKTEKGTKQFMIHNLGEVKYHFSFFFFLRFLLSK